MKCGGATLQQGAKRAAACAVAMHKGWGSDWHSHPVARQIHSGLSQAAEKHAMTLIGKGLTKWKSEATKLVRRAKRGGAPGKNGILLQRATGSPANRFGVAPCIPRAATDTPAAKEDEAVKRSSYNDYLQTTTHGRGANTRNAVGVPYNVDRFRRAVTTNKGGALMSSGVPGDDTLPDRAMKSGQELEAEFPVIQTCDVIHNYGGNDGTVEDITNYGLKRNPSSGMKLFKTR